MSKIDPRFEVRTCNIAGCLESAVGGHETWHYSTNGNEETIITSDTNDSVAVEGGEVRVTSPTGGTKGQKNVRLHAIPWESLAELGRVYAYGESKYDDYNYRKGYQWSLTFDAMVRHIWQFWGGDDRDNESGLHHMAHAGWHCMTLLFFSITKRGVDDRPPVVAVEQKGSTDR